MHQTSIKDLDFKVDVNVAEEHPNSNRFFIPDI
jgi:hypothetical protein